MRCFDTAQKNLKRFAYFFWICENLSEKLRRIHIGSVILLCLLWWLVIYLFINSSGVGNSIFVKDM